MKKYIALFAALLALVVSSCSNDDLVVDQSITFKVNPSTVVSPFTDIELVAGLISSVKDYQKLHVYLYIYDETGNLVASDEQAFSDYTHIMTSVQKLRHGNYTVVTLTTIINNEGDRFWTISGTDRLSTFTVKDNGYIGFTAKILGLSTKKVTVTETTKELSFDVECAGAVALVALQNYNTYTNIENLGVLSTQKCDEVKLDNNANMNYTFQIKSTYGWWLAKWPFETEDNLVLGYFFMFPHKDVKMTFAAETPDSFVSVGTTCTTTIQKNHAYWFTYDFEDDETIWFDFTESSSLVKASMKRAYKNNLINDMLQYTPTATNFTIAQ